ncbi:MAG: Ig-like domain-containing protein [Stagnimonas sp.]|nr:Ig-like domain-containing protein [Stagnimonas sp.]
MNSFAMAVRAVRLFLLSGFAALALWGCGGGGNTPTLQTIEISPLNASVPAGTSQQYTAMAIFSDNTKTDVTASTAWLSSDATTATINSAGLAMALKVGTVTISGSYQGQSASTVLTVSAAVVTSVAVTPVNTTLAKGSTGQARATATFSDRSTRDVTAMASWASSSPAVATVSNTDGSRGLVTAVSVGSTNISASFQSVTGSTALTVTAAALVSIEVSPANPTVPKGRSGQFTATGTYTDNSTQNLTTSVTWSSSNTAVASISNEAGKQGFATAVGTGTSTIKAVSGNIEGSTGLTVTDAVLTALQVTPSTSAPAKGTTQQFTATGTYSDQSTQDLTGTVVWSSSDAAVASISNASGSSGLASALTEGTATITATSDALSSTASLTVTAATLSRIDITPSQPSIPVGTSQQFTATAVYTDSSTQDVSGTATWASSDSSVLEVSNSSGQRGFAVANKLGTATVTASIMGVTGSTVATVSDATLTAIQVTPANRSLAKGFSLQYTAVGTYSDNSTRDITAQVTWASSNTGVASISNADGSRGLATASITPGTATISAASGSRTGATSLTVTNVTLSSVTVTPTNPTLAKGTQRALTATANFSDSSTQDVTSQASWSSSDSTKATVSDTAGSKGLVVAVAVGSSTITAALSNAEPSSKKSGTTSVTVNAATLSSIQVTPSTASAAKGTQQAFAANGTYSDGTMADITTTVTWSSSSTAVATISNTSPNNGKATIAGTGTTTISAVLSGITATASLTGTAAVLTSIDVTPKAPSVAAGRTQQFVATGTYSDATTQVITAAVTWVSSNTDVATISNADGSRGLASSTTSGTTGITAASGTITSAAVTLKVTNAVPVSLAATPANQTISNKSTQQFTAMETFSDGSVVDQTKAVNWTSSNTAVVDISNATDSKGLATAKTQGTVTITATDASVTPNITVNTTLTVGPAELQSIAVTTKAASLPAGYKVQYTATGSYTDGSTQDITTSVAWSTLNTDVATVSDAAGSKGMVTTVALGSTSVRATFSGLNGSATITVNDATLTSITVTPAGRSVGGGDTVQYTALANFSNGTTFDITKQVLWDSSNDTAATIDQNGLATGATGGASVFGGTTTIRATKGTVMGSVTLTRSPGP